MPSQQACTTWPALVLTSSAGPSHRQLTGRPMSEGMAAEASTASRSLTTSSRWLVSTAAAAATAPPAPSQPEWKLPSAATSGCQATCTRASPGRSARLARLGSTRDLLEYVTALGDTSASTSLRCRRGRGRGRGLQRAQRSGSDR